MYGWAVLISVRRGLPSDDPATACADPRISGSPMSMGPISPVLDYGSHAFRADADIVVVLSNDSDLMEPIRLVSQELGYRVGILNPHPNVSRALQRTRPSFTKQIRHGALATSQFPAQLSDATGLITKPATW